MLVWREHPIFRHAFLNFDGVKIACLAGTPQPQTCSAKFRWSEIRFQPDWSPSKQEFFLIRWRIAPKTGESIPSFLELFQIRWMPESLLCECAHPRTYFAKFRWSPTNSSLFGRRTESLSDVRAHPERVRNAPLKIALNERLDEPDLSERRRE